MILDVDSVAVFERYGIFLKMFGLTTKPNKYLCGAYNITICVLFTFLYPVHLLVGLLESENEVEIFNNLTLNISVVLCTSKLVVYLFKLRQLHTVTELFGKIDGRVHHTEERANFRNVLLRQSHFIINLFLVIYTSVVLLTLMTAVMGGNRDLVYHAWFPFDYRASGLNFAVAVGYQVIGLGVEAIQNWINDIYPPLSMCMLAGHIHLLAIRISKIGINKDFTPEQNYEELTACIDDYYHLMRIYDIIQDIISWVIFTQFVANGVNICIAGINLLFLADNFFDYVGYAMIFIAIAVEFYPTCYYGSLLELELQGIKHAIYSCNWIDQSPAFRTNIIIFTEISMKVRPPYAGGMVPTDLTSYIASCKMAYSCFTLLLSMK